MDRIISNRPYKKLILQLRNHNSLDIKLVLVALGIILFAAFLSPVIGGKAAMITGTYTVLFTGSLFYNRLVAWLEKSGLLDGLKAVLVVGGCIYTLATSAPLMIWTGVAGGEAVLVIAGSFFFSLLPVTVGDIARHLEAKRGEIKFWEQFTKKQED